MKQVYICGDSFGVCDPEYPGVSWHEKLAKKLYPTVEIVNLSLVCASNLLISLQVDHAISCGANFIIAMGTSVYRDEVKITPEQSQLPLVDRFVDITASTNTKDQDLISYTWLNINQTFLKNQTSVLKQYFLTQDLELLIYKDQCIIESTLQKLVDSNIPFVFDQGGFENKMYSTSDKEYFKKFQSFMSQKNLWNYVPERTFRPYFHLVDEKTTTEVADYYYNIIMEKSA